MWILGSFIKDLLFIITPSIWGILLAQTTNEIILFSSINILLMTNIVDQGHIYATLFRLPKKLNKYYYIIPLLVFICFTALFYFQFKYTLFLISYYALFHFYKQHEGFIRLYFMKNKRYDPIPLYLFLVFAIVSTIAYHFNPNSVYNYNIRILLFNNAEIFHWFKILTFLTIIIWIGYIFKEIIKNQLMNNLVIYISYTMFFMTYAHIYSTNAEGFIFTHLLGHGVPYLALVFHSNKKLRNWNWKKNLTAILSVILMFALIDFSLDSIYDKQTFNDLYELIKHPTIYIAMLGALTTTPQVCHFIIDRYIWKITNPDAKKIYSD